MFKAGDFFLINRNFVQISLNLHKNNDSPPQNINSPNSLHFNKDIIFYWHQVGESLTLSLAT